MLIVKWAPDTNHGNQSKYPPSFTQPWLLSKMEWEQNLLCKKWVQHPIFNFHFKTAYLKSLLPHQHGRSGPIFCLLLGESSGCDWLSIAWAYSEQETESWALLRVFCQLTVYISKNPGGWGGHSLFASQYVCAAGFFAAAPPPFSAFGRSFFFTMSTILFRSYWVPFWSPPFSACRRSFCPSSFYSEFVGSHFELRAAHPYWFLPGMAGMCKTACLHPITAPLMCERSSKLFIGWSFVANWGQVMHVLVYIGKLDWWHQAIIWTSAG